MEGRLRIAQTEESGREIRGYERSEWSMAVVKPCQKPPIAAQLSGKSNLLKATQENGEITFLHDYQCARGMYGTKVRSEWDMLSR